MFTVLVISNSYAAGRLRVATCAFSISKLILFVTLWAKQGCCVLPYVHPFSPTLWFVIASDICHLETIARQTFVICIDFFG